MSFTTSFFIFLICCLFVKGHMLNIVGSDESFDSSESSEDSSNAKHDDQVLQKTKELMGQLTEVKNKFDELFVITGVCKAECPDGWTQYQSSCYFFGHHDMTFMDSEHFCTHYGAHLVTIENAVENNFIASVLQELNSNRHWIGLTDEIVEGVWRWYSTDQVASYTDWYPGQPDLGSKANCANIYSGAPYAYHWLDDVCESSRFRPICEKGINSETQIVG